MVPNSQTKSIVRLSKQILYTQLWGMGRGTTVWRAAPGLYYRMVEEVIRRSVAAHGPALQTDFDTKLVRSPGHGPAMLSWFMRFGGWAGVSGAMTAAAIASVQDKA